MPLTEEDELVYGLLKAAGVLQPVDAHLLDEKEGVILVPCGDGDQVPDIFLHHVDICRVHRPDSRIHMLSLNGGALLIPESSPLNKVDHEDVVLMKHIQQARDPDMKNIHTVALYAHRPCGAARRAGFDFRDTVRLLMEAKQRLKDSLNPEPKLTVACFLHIARRDGARRTYFVSPDAWLKWRGSNRFAE